MGSIFIFLEIEMLYLKETEIGFKYKNNTL